MCEYVRSAFSRVPQLQIAIFFRRRRRRRTFKAIGKPSPICLARLFALLSGTLDSFRTFHSSSFFEPIQDESMSGQMFFVLTVSLSQRHHAILFSKPGLIYTVLTYRMSEQPERPSRFAVIEDNIQVSLLIVHLLVLRFHCALQKKSCI